jgi:hypothetical protein
MEVSGQLYALVAVTLGKEPLKKILCPRIIHDEVVG